MTDITNDPVAAAAAQIQSAEPSSTEPGFVERLEAGMHALEEKVEHLIHPEASVVGENVACTDTAPAAGAAITTGEQGNVAPAAAGASSEASASVAGEDPNAGASAAAEPSANGTASYAPPASLIGVKPFVGIVNVGNVIRNHLAAIKRHLSLRGFEQSVVQDIHAEISEIEKYL